MNKEDVFKLQDPKITIREKVYILDEISQTVDEIWRYICEQQNRELDWWAFQNDEEEDVTSGGDFDIGEDIEYITIIGERSSGYYDGSKFWDKLDFTFENGFPTELLWDNCWKATVNKQIHHELDILQKNKEKKTKVREDYKSKRLELAKQLSEKLTIEEIHFICTNLTNTEKKILKGIN